MFLAIAATKCYSKQIIILYGFIVEVYHFGNLFLN